MKLDRKYAQRFQILIVTHYIQTHKVAKQHPRPNERKVELHFNLLTAFISSVYELHLPVVWQSMCWGGAGGLHLPAGGECVGFPCAS